jgi:hypothetical protein
MKKLIVVTLPMLSSNICAQDKDSINTPIQRSVLRNYPTTRPINVEYDQNGGDRYHVKKDGNTLETGKVKKN